MKLGPLLLALLLLAPLLPATEAAGAEPKARWHGPTGMMEGWHVRIPLQVTNTLDTAILDGVVSYDLRLADFLMEAGWVTSRKGTSAMLESWELDPDSLRVIEYRAFSGSAAIDGVPVGEVPSRAVAGLYDSTRPYSNRTQPDIHVEWVMPDKTEPNATRTFFVQVDTLANGRKEPSVYSEQQMAPIEGRGWVSRGTTLYGMAGQLTLIGLEDGTSARVDVYSGTAPFPLTSGGAGGIPNPIPLRRLEVQSLPIAENDALVRIVSNKPLIAYGNPVGMAAGGSIKGLVGPIPSINGGLLGTEWLVPESILAVLAVTPGPAARITYSGGSAASSGSVSLTGGAPSALIPLVGPDAKPSSFPTYIQVKSNVPILLLSYSFDAAKAQYPTLWGAPAGSRVIALPIAGDTCGMGTEGNGGEGPNCSPTPRPPCSDGSIQAHQTTPGSALVTTLTPDTYVRGRDHITGALRFPQESEGRPAELAQLVSPGTARLESFRPTQITARTAVACPILFHAVKSAADVQASEGPDVVVYAGGLQNALGNPQGSPSGKDFWTYWDVSVVAHHNGTQVTVTQPGKPDLRRTLGKGDALEVDGTFSNPAHVQSTKPVVLLARSEPSSVRVGGARGWFAGFDDSLLATPAGAPQYRGYLVSLEPGVVSTEPMQGLAAPGKASTYKLLVKNLAKDDKGNGVPDTVHLALGQVAEGWTAELSATTLRLQGGESAVVTLQVAPPADAREGAKTSVNVTAASEGNPRMTDRIQAYTTIRASYEVGVWFDREGSPPGKTLTLDPAETKDVRVVVKNLATVPDHVTVRATLGSADWRTRWDGSPSPLLDLALEPGESRPLTLKLSAPEAKASQTTLTILATSVSDASAGAKQDATARVRADVRIALVPVDEGVVEAPPGTQARLQVAFENRGNDRVGIRFNTTGALPDGWPRPIVMQGPYEIDELAGIEPGSRVLMDVLLDVPPDARRGDRANVHFFVETIPQFAGDPVLRESVDLLILTGARHALEPVDPLSTVPLGLGDEVRAQLTLANAGNGIESLRVVPREVPEGATVDVGALARVPVGEKGAVEMGVTFPSFIAAGTYRVAADVISDDGHVVPWEFNVSVPDRRAASLHPLGALQGIAGVAESVRIEIANDGNVDLSLPPKILAPIGWNQSWSAPATPRLLPGASTIMTLTLTAPLATPARVHALAVAPDWAETKPLPWDLRTVVLSATATREGEGVSVRLDNAGTGDALLVDLVLLQDDVEVDKVTLQRVAAGSGSTAILAPRDGGEGDLVVVVDNATRYSPQAQRALVQGAAPLNGTPGPAPLLVVAAGLAVALALRRRR